MHFYLKYIVRLNRKKRIPGVSGSGSSHEKAEDVQVPSPLHLEVKVIEVSELHV